MIEVCWTKTEGTTTTAVSFRRENVERKNVHKWSTNKKHDCMKRQMLHFFNAPYWTNPHYIKYKARYYIKIKLNYFLLLIPTTHSLFDYKVKMKCRNLICISLKRQILTKKDGNNKTREINKEIIYLLKQVQVHMEWESERSRIIEGKREKEWMNEQKTN